MQDELTKLSEEAWNTSAYDAWLERFGPPAVVAEKLKKDPISKLSSLYNFLGEVEGKKIANLLGSHGIKATSLALLGANVTVIDFSEPNKQYAVELAKEAEVPLRYLVHDILHLPKEEQTADYDLVFSEFGILHYFLNLDPFFQVAANMLKPKGKFIIQDFHPISKMITSTGTTHKIRKHKITGDYFDASLVESEVSYSKFLKDKHLKPEKVMLRKWTMGEIVTSIAAAGFIIKILEELPNMSSEVYDQGIPKTFTIVAEKI